jgi:hypothetical protein
MFNNYFICIFLWKIANLLNNWLGITWIVEGHVFQVGNIASRIQHDRTIWYQGDLYFVRSLGGVNEPCHCPSAYGPKRHITSCEAIGLWEISIKLDTKAVFLEAIPQTRSSGTMSPPVQTFNAKPSQTEDTFPEICRADLD